MQSHYSKLPNAMSVTDAKTFAVQRQATSEHLMVYRGVSYTLPKPCELNAGQVAVGRSLPTGIQLHYRGATYISGGINHSVQPERVANQPLVYRGITYIPSC